MKNINLRGDIVKERYYAEIDNKSNNYIRLIKIEEDNLNKEAYIYDSSSKMWVKNSYLLEYEYDTNIYDEMSKEDAYTIISRWEKSHCFLF